MKNFTQGRMFTFDSLKRKVNLRGSMILGLTLAFLMFSFGLSAQYAESKTDVLSGLPIGPQPDNDMIAYSQVGITSFTDLGSFLAICPDAVLEDFENGVSGGCTSPVSEGSGCFPAGELQTGFTLSTNDGTDLYYVVPGEVMNPNGEIGPDLFATEQIIIDFPAIDEVTSVAFDHSDYWNVSIGNEGSLYNVTVVGFDMGTSSITTLGTYSFVGNSAYLFSGFQIAATGDYITQVIIDGGGFALPDISALYFGSCTVPTIANCALPCNNNVQVSLDGNCEAMVTPDMILEDEMDDCIYSVVVSTLDDFIIPTSPIVTSDYIGQTLKAQVFNGTNNNCWSYIHIEDKLAPILTCLDDLTVSCNAWFNELDFTPQVMGGLEVVGENISDLALNTVTVDVENTSNQIHYTESIELTLGLSYAPLALLPQDISVTVLDASMNLVYTGTETTNLGLVDIDITGVLADLQTLDEYYNGLWTITVDDLTADAVEVTLETLELAIYTRGPGIDNCSNTYYETVDIEEDDHDCTFDGFSYKKIFSYRAFDAYDNTSQICELAVYFERKTLSDLVFPGDTILGCTDDEVALWDRFLQNNYPDAHILEAGAPLLDGKPIYPNEHYCEINLTFEDQVIDLCEGNYKILRKWTALDWCDPGVLAEEYQIIKVGDFDGIIVATAPSENTEFPTDVYECLGVAVIDPPIIEEVCSTVQYSVSFLLADENGAAPVDGIYQPTGVIYDIDEKATIEDLPLGRTWVRYTVFDDCGNFGEAFTEVDIYDNVPPYPVCDQFTAVTLTQSGWAQIYAESFDDGSHDNCTALWFGVRRMDYSGSNHFCEDGEDDLIQVSHVFNGNIYYEFEQFCCEDVGNPDLMVEMIVCDEYNNCNTCMVNVEVQDKIDFGVICPPDVTVDCRVDLTDYSIVGKPDDVKDNCGDAILTYTDDYSNLNSCGLGVIERTWTATIGEQERTCVQDITLKNLNPDYDLDGPDELVELEGCMSSDTDPSNTGEPTYNDDLCSLMSSTYDDQVFYFADGACFKIVREWTVIDWCLYDYTNGADGLWHFNQVIKVNNFVKPEILNCEDITALAYGEFCDEYVNVVLMATDDCTSQEQLVYHYEIDYFSDGSINDFGSTNDASGVYEVGMHTIYWSVEDMCGNTELCEYIIDVVDDKNPTPYCLGGITTVVMNNPADPTVTIWASDFDLGSYDNCDGFDIYLSFTDNIADSSMVFGCEHLGLQEVQIWVTDSYGNQDFCSTMINIQDHSDLCGMGAGNVVTVTGRVVSETDISVQNVEIELVEMDFNASQTFSTVSDGSYAFVNQATGIDYSISASRNDNPLNGVSTLDLVLIQKHILGLQMLDSPYKVIAADANNSESVTAVDLVELRKLILGIYTDFPSNESWRFVRESFPIADANQPWPLEEKITIDNISTDMTDNDFIGIKVGDVNANATYSFDGGIATENRWESFDFIAAEQTYSTGELINVDIKVDKATDLLGYQYTITFGNDLEFVGYESRGTITVDDSNFGKVNNNSIATSWSSGEAVALEASNTLYSLKFRALSNGTLSKSLEFNSNLTPSEVVIGNLEQRSTKLSFEDAAAVQNDLVVYQNNPNPFTKSTTIDFELSQDADVNVKISDLTGKIIYDVTRFYAAGKNSLLLDAETLNASGMVYYQIATSKASVTKKMLILN